MADNHQQYMWRQRKKRNLRVGIWLVFVVVASAAGTFAFEGIRDSDPKRAAERYFMRTVGVEGYAVSEGDGTLGEGGQLVKDFTFQYTADGKQVAKTVGMVQSDKKKYGLFASWVPQSAADRAVAFDVVAPAGSQVLADGHAPDMGAAVADESLSAGAARYHFAGVDPQATLQVNGLPFEAYEAAVPADQETVDVRDSLVLSENARVQMEELGKAMLHELYTAAIEGSGAEKLGGDFANVPNKDNLYRSVSNKLRKGGELLVDSVTFSGFGAQFGDVQYPEKDAESYVSVDMTLSYTFAYEAAQGDAQEPQTEETQADEQQTESGQAGDGEAEAAKSQSRQGEKEAKFTFHYQDGACTAATMEVSGDLP